MGAEAVPFEIRALARTDSAFDGIYRRAFSVLPSFVKAFLPKPVDRREIRQAASSALFNNPETKKFMPQLVRLLKHKDPEVRGYTCLLIGEYLSAENENLFPLLIAALHDRDPFIRQSIAYSFAVIGYLPEAAVPELKKLVADANVKDSRREIALRTLEPVPPRRPPIYIKGIDGQAR
jgi:hypothetical protein